MFEKSVTRLVQDVVLNGPMEARDICKMIGKPYSTLLREINPFDGRAKLGIETFMDIVRVTGNSEPLKFLARELDFTLTPRSKPSRSTVYDQRPEAGL